MKIAMILILSLCLCGCTVAFQNLNDPGVENIVAGMSKEEAIEIMGEPLSQRDVTIDGKNYQAWRYPVPEPTNKKYNRMGKYAYRILFLDGKVYDIEKIKVYAQPSYEFDEPSALDEDKTTIKFYKGK